MNYQLSFKKMALSAMMLSAVVAPAVTNADSAPKDAEPMATLKTATVTTAATASEGVVVIGNNWANPLELAKTYAPNTLEDWKQTLEQYKKVAGETNTVQYFVAMDKAELKPGEAFEIKDIVFDKLPEGTVVTGEANKVQYSIAMEKSELKSDQISKINAHEVTVDKLPSISVSVKATEAKNFQLTKPSEDMKESSAEKITDIAVRFNKIDQAFVDAQVALSDVAKSKDAAAITDALTKLLEQYKLQIAELEAAK